MESIWKGPQRKHLPELAAAVKRRFDGHQPPKVLRDGADRIEFWDQEDFPPWEALRWERVRVIRYRQHHPDGTVVEAEWLTNLCQRKVPSLSLYRMAAASGRLKTRSSTIANHARDSHTSAITISIVSS